MITYYYIQTCVPVGSGRLNSAVKYDWTTAPLFQWIIIDILSLATGLGSQPEALLLLPKWRRYLYIFSQITLAKIKHYNHILIYHCDSPGWHYTYNCKDNPPFRFENLTVPWHIERLNESRQSVAQQSSVTVNLPATRRPMSQLAVVNPILSVRGQLCIPGLQVQHQRKTGASLPDRPQKMNVEFREDF